MSWGGGVEKEYLFEAFTKDLPSFISLCLTAHIAEKETFLNAFLHL